MARPPDPRAREALLEAARVEFARNGPEQARIEDVTRRAGLSKGAFYLHFRSKEHAFELIVQRFLGALEEFARRRDSAGARPGHPPDLEQEVRWDAELLGLLWENRLLLAAVDGAGGRSWTRQVTSFRQRIRELVAGRLGERQASGQLRRDLDPAVVADVVLGAYEGAGRRMVELRERPDLDAWARTLLTVLYGGMLEAAPPRMTDRPVTRPRKTK
jgi:AcrR family transcriptional regulator